MKKQIIGTLLVVMLATAGAAFAQDDPFAPENFSATMYLTTDYVSRGISFSGEDPAIQGHFDYAHPSGMFAGIWASSWDSAELSNNIETGYYAGYGGALGDVGYSLSANYYAYPDADDDAAEWNYWEFMASANYTLDQLALTPALGIGYVFSPDWFGEDGNMHYGNTTLDLALPMNLGLGFEVGYFDLEGDKFTGNGFGLDGGDGYDYVHYRASIYTSLVGFGLDLSYHNTNEGDAFDDIGYFADDRVVFTLSRSL